MQYKILSSKYTVRRVKILSTEEVDPLLTLILSSYKPIYGHIKLISIFISPYNMGHTVWPIP